VAVNSVTVLYAVVVTPLAGIPRYLTLMFDVPLGGAAENVSVVPDTEYVLGSCKTPVIATMIDDVFAGATVIVKVVSDPVPLNVSTRNATDNG